MYASEDERLIPDQGNSQFLLVVAIIAGIALLAALAWYFLRDSGDDDELLLDKIALSNQPEPGTVQRDEEPEEVEPPPMLEPIELKSGYVFPEPLPELDDSDAELLEQLGPLSESEELTNWAPSDDLARKLTAVAYSLADGEVAYEYLSLPAPEGKFKVTAGKGKKIYINSDNYARYDVFVKAVQALDVDHAVAFYLHYWPLLRTAFAELGEADKSLQREVMTAIDLLLETPDVDGDIELVRPSVYYKYADKELEKLKPAQKLLLRMGPDNRAAIKEKLQAFKEKLTFDDAGNSVSAENVSAEEGATPEEPTAEEESAPEVSDSSE
ncbi:MAG: DUF3014 domain-containing protein [Pseudomonadales bacterium]